ncbi:hypothetical protein ACFO0S_01695 [Chryseomicrobium palamuruense]|uniref:DUF3784 domain-containing protein n=1 Tax=Chryseomicrobium palamuruense TaxID=682973 RepID=A0ABV8USI7_9BACL
MSVVIVSLRILVLIVSIFIVWGNIRVYKIFEKEVLTEKEYNGVRKLLKVLIVALWVNLVVGVFLIFIT